MRALRLKARSDFRVCRGRDVHELLQPYFVGLQREHLWRVDLDCRGGVLGGELVSIGTVSMTLAEPREVFCKAITAGASSILIAHNHPSGNVAPSPQDHRKTRQLWLCGTILGIDLYDSVVVHGERFFSFRDAGLMGAPLLGGARRGRD